MKTKIILISVGLACLILLSNCHRNGQNDAWIECNSLGTIWDDLENQDIQRIAFCETDIEDIEKWYVRFEVPEECIEKTKELIGKALQDAKKRGFRRESIWDIYRMKIITDKHKYVVPVRWDSKKIYGIDWTSYELRDYLRKYGFADPK